MEKKNTRESGNVLIAILIAIALLALLTGFIAQTTDQQTDVLSDTAADSEITRLFTQVGALSAALQQMTVSGAGAKELGENLSTLKPGDAGFETAPHTRKIYHPLGGGVTYMEASNDSGTAVADSFSINRDTIIEGIGPTDALPGDIIFTARVSSSTYCARINLKITGSSNVPSMSAGTFNTLFNSTTGTTVNSSACSSCVGKPQLCVSNGASQWGFYAALIPN